MSFGRGIHIRSTRFSTSLLPWTTLLYSGVGNIQRRWEKLFPTHPRRKLKKNKQKKNEQTKTRCSVFTTSFWNSDILTDRHKTKQEKTVNEVTVLLEWTRAWKDALDPAVTGNLRPGDSQTNVIAPAHLHVHDAQIIAPHRVYTRSPDKSSKHSVKLLHVPADTAYHLQNIPQFRNEENIANRRSCKNRPALPLPVRSAPVEVGGDTRPIGFVGGADAYQHKNGNIISVTNTFNIFVFLTKSLIFFTIQDA